MSIKQLTTEEIIDLVGTHHAGTKMKYPSRGLQPYYEWLLQSLHLLAESSAFPFRVARDDANDTSVFILPGRASIGSVALDYTGETIDLAAYNNGTAYLWLEDDAGSPLISSANDATGWPGGAHIKLAEVTLAAGRITQIIDRRFETMLKG